LAGADFSVERFTFSSAVQQVRSISFRILVLSSMVDLLVFADFQFLALFPRSFENCHSWRGQLFRSISFRSVSKLVQCVLVGEATLLFHIFFRTFDFFSRFPFYFQILR
jgi:hypothetical protein